MMASLSMIVMAMLLLNQVPCAHFGDMFAVRNLSQCDNGDGDAVDVPIFCSPLGLRT